MNLSAFCRVWNKPESTLKVVAALSEELFDHQPEAYRNSVLPPEARYDLMVVSTGTRRVWPLRDPGPLTDAYSLTSDWDNQWLTGGLEPEVIAEAHLDREVDFCGNRALRARSWRTIRPPEIPARRSLGCGARTPWRMHSVAHALLRAAFTLV